MKAKVRIPATTANLGPGFDCLGLALNLHNDVAITPIEDDLQIEISGEGRLVLPHDRTNLIYRAVATLFQAVGESMGGLRIELTNTIPLMSGLGSSSAAIVGGLVAANALLEHPLEDDALLKLAVEIEGHPDNVTPALLGGLTIVIDAHGAPVYRQLFVPPMSVVLAVPRLEVATVDARAALPRHIPLADAAYNLGRTALVVQALTTADYDLLRHAMDDRLHQPYRAHLVPGLADVFTAAREAGAAGVALSGAGPSVIAFAPDGHQIIADAMQAAFANHRLPARTMIVSVSDTGAQVTLDPANRPDNQ